MLGEIYKDALDAYMERPLPWIVVNGVVALAGTVIPLLGGLALMPALLRETNRALAEDRDPSLSAMLDTSVMGDDLITMVLYFLAQCVGVLFCCVGWPIAWIAFYMTPEIRAIGLAGPGDAMSISATYVGRNLGVILGIVVIDWLLVMGGLGFAYVGLFLIMPIVTLSWTTHLRRARPQLEAIAAAR